MIQEEIEKTFDLKEKLPEAIIKICEFLDMNGYPISGCFELSPLDKKEWSMDWLGKEANIINFLRPFGRGASGDVYLLWLINNISLENAPVVMFGSTGEAKVLASNSLEFCKLLCLGYNEVGLEDHSVPSNKADYEEAKLFREYMITIYSFSLPEIGDEIINKAQKKFPNFENWVESYLN